MWRRFLNWIESGSAVGKAASLGAALTALVWLLTKKALLAGGCGLVILILTLILFRGSTSYNRLQYPKWRDFSPWPLPASRMELVVGMLLIIAFTLGAIAVIVWQQLAGQ